MIPPWILFTVSAAGFQTWRTAKQQKLRGKLSVNGAGVVRFLYGVPAGFVILGTYLALFGGSFGSFTPLFLFYCMLGGLGQILGTNLLIMSFDSRGFAVGTAYSKTEAIQAAFIALFLLGETLSPLSWAGIALSVSGVLTLSFAGKGFSVGAFIEASLQRGALLGIGAGSCFAICSIFIKSANIALDGDDPVLKALVCLVVINGMQTIMQGSWMLWREPGEVRRVFANWKDSMWVGALSASGSACWFSGFALAPVAMVRAVGQVEILFTLLASRFYLKERTSLTERVGALIVVAGVVLVLLGRH
ncbi:EamA/RhaT family transporter [Rhodovarius crocodyli]|uniref:EamA/RhaT family transporter n=1 Tax=Rhodovarius crocodyli TaxID=1979269 RepID=A0A437M2X9_9PROT|nr:EamA family transporter [Rhodovarius crocodyli]RVT91982.1 EamA/RhaT family transporter [Rhodovarius crocodyli]